MGENDEHFSQKYSQMSKNEGENTQKCAFPTLTIMNVYELIRQNPTIRYEQMEDNLGVDRSTIQRSIACSYFALLKRLLRCNRLISLAFERLLLCNVRVASSYLTCIRTIVSRHKKDSFGCLFCFFICICRKKTVILQRKIEWLIYSNP